jgi:SPP1 family predicted phage head-tail adaptor
VNPGRRRHQIYLQSSALTGDEGAGGAETWSDNSGPHYASVEPLKGDEALRGLQLQGTVTHRVTMRYRSGVTPKQRIRFGARFFDIRLVTDPEERREQLEILAEEVVG